MLKVISYKYKIIDTFLSLENRITDNFGSNKSLSGLISIGDWYFPLPQIGHLEPHQSGPVKWKSSIIIIFVNFYLNDIFLYFILFTTY